MGFKSGLLVGFGVGYVLGTKAGRERYEELKASWDQFMGNPSVQRAVTRGREVVETGTRRGIRAVEEAGDEVKDRLEGGPKAGTS
ncbi:MAG: YtxH domain-containing protein [Actinomycetota bacterium]